VNQPPEATVRYELMERIMPGDVTVDIPDRVLVIGTVKYYMTVGHKVWENQLFARGYDPTSNEVTYNICNNGSSKNLSLKALELSVGCRLEIIHVPGTTMITQRIEGLSRGIWENGFNTELKPFVVEFFLPAWPSLYMTKWDLSHIEILEDHTPWCNVETDTSLWEPHIII
jgi:hypothetical protein